MMIFFNVRKGRDPFFKFGMRRFVPNAARRYEAEFGIRFIGWFNITEGSEWNNVAILDLPSYAVLDRVYADPSAQGFAHRVGESIFERKQIILLRERMGPDLVFKP